MTIDDIKPEVYSLAEKAEELCKAQFAQIERVSELNTRKVMAAFQHNRVSESCFAGTTGYGYDDLGRETLDKVYAEVFDAESALVRIGFVNGTHALSVALSAISEPGKTILSATGLPYDTLQETIGISSKKHGSLAFYGVGYSQVDLLENGQPDIPRIISALRDEHINAVIIQRSRGYGVRKALTVEEIEEICTAVKSQRPDVRILVDNCYGEFTDTREPLSAGADLIAGSLIKNPGGGIAPTGGYIAGKKELVDIAAMHLTTPGIGGECGSTLGNNRLLFQGFFMAPHTVAQALKTAVFCSAMLSLCGIETSPDINEKRSDIIQVAYLKSPDLMKKFCAGIQAGAPVDSYVTPEPWPMPGYNCDVIMAAGAFIQGASIEISADGPIREPYCIYLQGGLTYESGKLAVMMAVNNLI